MRQLETKRLILRAWETSDSSDLFEYAKNPIVGPNAGWSPHKDEEESKQIIKMFKTQQEYAIVLKDSNKVIGGIGVFNLSEDSNLIKEVGYVLNPDYWGNAYVPEAVEEIKRYCFEDMKIDELWCGHFDFNKRSKRVNEKCGFKYQKTQVDILDRHDHSKVNTLMYRILKSEYFNN